MGSALNHEEETRLLSALIDQLRGDIKIQFEVPRMEPPFKNKEEFEFFEQRHAQAQVATADLSSYRGNAFLGIDAGSTTTKAAVINSDKELLYEHYQKCPKSYLYLYLHSF
jgi:activator of 2-hydroxyglutaryl-CoA dehydratase